jgi:hypothetical protein
VGEYEASKDDEEYPEQNIEVEYTLAVRLALLLLYITTAGLLFGYLNQL